ncbi:MAG: hypothetical protein KJ558_00255 [Gammaproteobacteria bacterium]|nr:hypothetical protein [Gammaproteobacteria bacterium]MBU1653274.1 hypothetical protein [Gammaproteobacteria bacterium]MBU1961500.1 hypothetical protein [Gammaproteobacteria bacterium]
MATHENETLKQREIPFCKLHPDTDQAGTAALLLQDIPGVQHVKQLSPTLLSIRYDLAEIGIRQIEELLVELGFHLAGNLMQRLMRALHYYAEETQLANMAMGCVDCDSARTRKIFIERYARLCHGCRDPHSEIWRHYR